MRFEVFAVLALLTILLGLMACGEKAMPTNCVLGGKRIRSTTVPNDLA